MKQVTRYHPLLVGLHWLLAVMLIGMLTAGFLVVGQMPNADPRKLDILTVHMSGGMLVLLLMLIRLGVRHYTAKPAAAKTGNALLDRLGRITHYSFYALVVLIVGSGLTTAIIAGLNRSVFQRSGEPLPADFDVYPTFLMHGTLAILLCGLIVLHVTAALWHQFLRKDGLLGRMGFGSRT